MEHYRRDTPAGPVHDPATDRPEEGHTSDSAVDDIRTVYDPSRPNWAGNDGLDAQGDVRRSDENDENDEQGKRDGEDALDGTDQSHPVDRGSDDLDGADRSHPLDRGSDDLDEHGGDNPGTGRPFGESAGMAGNPDPAHDSRELGDPSDDASEGRAAAERDLLVYPEDADYPTRAQDSGLTAMPEVKPEPVAARNDVDERSGETRYDGAGTGLGGVGTEPATGDVSAGAGGVSTGSGSENPSTGTGDVGGGTEGAFGAGDFERRWREVQASFVDDPRDAVARADQLVDEAVAAIASRKQSLVDRWKNGDQNDTERLRLALRDYRSLLQELVGLSYSGAGHGSAPAETK